MAYLGLNSLQKKSAVHQSGYRPGNRDEIPTGTVEMAVRLLLKLAIYGYLAGMNQSWCTSNLWDGTAEYCSAIPHYS
jgi:hypothetical protein